MFYEKLKNYKLDRNLSAAFLVDPVSHHNVVAHLIGPHWGWGVWLNYVTLNHLWDCVMLFSHLHLARLVNPWIHVK